MDNRDRDKVSQSDQPTDAGKVDRDTDAGFGQNIGRSEKWDEDPSRRSISDEETLDMKRKSSSSGGRMTEH